MKQVSSRPARRVLAAGAVGALALTAALGTLAGAAPGAASSDPATDSAVATGVDTSSAIVQLSLAPLTVSPRTKPAHGKKIDFSSATVKSERALLSAQRHDFKRWLRSVAPKAKVTGEFDTAVNAVAVTLNGTPLSALSAGPGVTSVSYEGRYVPLDGNDPDLPLIHAIAAWSTPAVGGAASAGAGVKVGIIDSGIDNTHPCFDGHSYPKFTGNAGDPQFTNDKIVVAKVFNNNAKNAGYTPKAVESHGTHVAGTVACELDTPASVDGVPISYGVSGVAPAAQLGNYNVFPGDVADARSEDILNALDAAAQDGMDVINMSLGGDAHGIQDLLTIAVDNLDAADIVVAVSNGNSGPGYFTVGSPGSAERALSAGASSVGHFIGVNLTVGGSTWAAATGQFPVPTTDLTLPLGVVKSGGSLSTACEQISDDLSNTIAVISRGTCSFSQKILNAENAGASAVVVVNNAAGAPISMGSDGTANQPTVPAVMVGIDALSLLITSNGKPATLGAPTYQQNPADSNIMAGFSSQGPTDVDFRVKPDVVAPGLNVLSSIPGDCGTPGCWAFFSGTSMAAPHLAGIAAVIRGAHPGWTAEQVRSAIVNTATQDVLHQSTGSGTAEKDVNVVGAGLADTVAALDATVAVGPVSTSFGAVPSGSGRTLTRSVRLTSLDPHGNSVTVTLKVDGGPFSVGGLSVEVPSAGVDVPVSVSLGKGTPKGPVQSFLRVTSGGVEIAHAALYVYVK